jgi:D-arabinose 1-dehydrogenase-like Zn-dependent alcohol dehydrogenase
MLLPGLLLLDDVFADVQSAEPDEILIKLNATGLCLSDVHFMLNDWAVPKMTSLGTNCAGHEVCSRLQKRT